MKSGGGVLEVRRSRHVGNDDRSERNRLDGAGNAAAVRGDRRWLIRALVALFASAFVVAGSAGVVRYVETFWLYRGFAAPTQARFVFAGSGRVRARVRVIPGSVTTFAFRPAALGGRAMHVVVYLPPNYAVDTSTRYPVLYLLHGDPGAPVQFINVGDLAVVSNNLVAERRIAPMIVVMPPGSSGFFSDSEWANSIRPNNAWETYVATELVAMVDRRYRTIDSGTERGIGGLSEGAYGALNIGFHHVGEFDLIEAWSPYYDADRSILLFGNNSRLLAYNSPAVELPKVAAGLRAHHTYIWFYTGSRDHGNRQSLDFAQQLAALHLSSHYFVYAGHHNWKLWRTLMSGSLETASAYFSHHQLPTPTGSRSVS